MLNAQETLDGEIIVDSFAGVGWEDYPDGGMVGQFRMEGFET